MKILITGGAGFIGSNFAHYWTKHHPEDSVVVLDALTYAGNLENLEEIKNKITFVKGDICDSKIVNGAMSEVDTVVHFAAESHVDRSVLDPQSFIRTNVLGTGVLLDAARANNVKRFHHVSTDEVFGHIELGSDERWNEQSAYNPRSPYSASKAGSDHLVRAYNITYGLPITISNCANNIGRFMFPEKFFPLAITHVLEGKKVPIYKPGNQVREWLHVDDHCSAIDLILQKGKIGETYFISPDNEELTNLEVIKKLLAFMGKDDSWVEFVGDRPGHDQKYALDHSKITSELGWKPQHDLDSTLKEMIDWYTQNRSWWEKIKSGEYQKYYEQNYSSK